MKLVMNVVVFKVAFHSDYFYLVQRDISEPNGNDLRLQRIMEGRDSMVSKKTSMVLDVVRKIPNKFSCWQMKTHQTSISKYYKSKRPSLGVSNTTHISSYWCGGQAQHSYKSLTYNEDTTMISKRLTRLKHDINETKTGKMTLNKHPNLIQVALRGLKRTKTEKILNTSLNSRGILGKFESLLVP